jgi:ComEC/Rec2-related protein
VVGGLSGKLASDSRTTKGGYRLYPLEVESLVLEAEEGRARLGASGQLSLLVEGSPALVAGDEVEASELRILGEGLAICERESFYARASPAPVRRLRALLKGGWHRALEAVGGGGASSGLLVALLEGRRDGLDLEEAQSFTKAGCVAVLSLSGQHLSILAAALALVLRPLGGPYRARLGALLLALVFVFVAGPEPALLRSLVMFALSTLAILTDRPQDSRTILGLSFVIQLGLDPASARGLSFSLSYLALAGLVVLSARFEYLFLPVLPPFLAKALAASCAAFLPTLPLAGASFGVVYPVGILASVVSAPLVAAFIWWGLGASCLCLFLPFLAPVLAFPTLAIHRALGLVMDFFARAPGLDLAGRGLIPASASVVLILAIVYALPYADHARLRRTHGPQGLPRDRGPGHVQAPRAELPGQPQCQGEDTRGRPRPRGAVSPARP